VPKPAFTLEAGSSSYAGKIEGGGQTMALSLTQTFKEEAGSWVISGTAKMPMGDATDVVTLDKATLVPRKRSVRQGPVAIDLVFEGGKAAGTFAMGSGEPKPVNVDLGGELFADGVGSHEVVATLPLAEGYAVTFRNFDMQQQKVQLKQAKVVGSEDATVPAGTFKAWKVEIASAEGEPGVTTVWVAQTSRKVLKTVTTLPQMGGAIVTFELQK
jgi:hypothetical protein